MRTLIIAEAGVNHDGDVSVAIEMVRAAHAAGADIVKFQHFRTDTVVAPGTGTATYQESNTGKTSQADLLRPLEIGLDGFKRISAACREMGIGFLCTPFDPDSVSFLVDLGMPYIKIPSGELTNLPLLRDYARFKLPIILSTGMAALPEVETAIATLDSAGAREIILLHCTSLYPAPPGTLNLRAIVTLRELTGRAVGYSDHSLGDHAALAAVALGATVVEKHFTLGRTRSGPDHRASLEPDAFATMVQRIRELEVMLGDGMKRPAPGEADVARLVRRSWHARRPLRPGMAIAPEDVILLRPACGLPPSFDPVGRLVVRNVAQGAALTRDDVAK